VKDNISRYCATEDSSERYLTADERTFRCACEARPSMPQEPRFAPTLTSGWGRAPDAWKNEVAGMNIIKSKWCNPADPLALRFCFMIDDPPAGMGPPTEDEEVEMRIDSPPNCNPQTSTRMLLYVKLLRTARNSSRRYSGQS
jgi:hypothetical protein